MAKRPMVMRLLFYVALSACCTGCMFHHHRIGSGPTGIGSTTVRQYYAGFGLWRLNEVDTQRYTENAVSYDITSEFNFTDLLISALLSPVTITTRTLTIDR